MLTSLRTIAGAIGTAVFVGILNVFSTRAGASYSNAGIYGLHVTFSCMTVVAVIMLFIMVFGMKKGKKIS